MRIIILLLACCSNHASTPAEPMETPIPSPTASDPPPSDPPSASPTPSPMPTMDSLGTYIALGDSISDLGGTGPFFYDLLLNNDDTTYPAQKGHDLSTRFPGIRYDHRAVAG
jgi:hypothetical protein